MKIKGNKKLIAVILCVSLLLIFSTLLYAKGNISEIELQAKKYKDSVWSIKGNDVVVATVGDVKVYEWEVADYKWQYENSPDGEKPFSESENTTEGIIKMIAKRKLFLAEAQKYGIEISDDKRQEIRKRVLDSFDKNLEKNQLYIDALGVTKEEMIEFVTESHIEALIERELIKKMIPTLLDDKFSTSDENLKTKIDDFKKNKEPMGAYYILEEYKEFLYNNAKK